MGQKYRLVGRNHYHNGERLQRGDVVELSEAEISGFSHKFTPVETEDSETEDDSDDVSVAENESSDDPPFDPANSTVSEIRAHVSNTDDTDEIEALLHAEREGKNRNTAISAIESEL